MRFSSTGENVRKLSMQEILFRIHVLVFTEEIYLLSKGAETAILDRVIEGDISSTLLHVNEYAVVCISLYQIFL